MGHTRAVKDSLAERDIPVIPNPSHIIPLLVGNAELAKKASDMLLDVHAIYYPTVPVGQERLRITPTPGHVREFREHLVGALESVWNELGIKRTSAWAKEGGFIGVGEPGLELPEPLWTDAQVGVTEALLERETNATAKAVAAAA